MSNNTDRLFIGGPFNGQCLSVSADRIFLPVIEPVNCKEFLIGDVSQYANMEKRHEYRLVVLITKAADRIECMVHSDWSNLSAAEYYSELNSHQLKKRDKY